MYECMSLFTIWTDIMGILKAHRGINIATVSPYDTLIYNSVFLYCQLEDDLRLYNPKKLSIYLKENMIYIYPHNKILRQTID